MKTEQEPAPRVMRKRRFGSTGRNGASVCDALDRFFERHRGHDGYHLMHLWDNWPMVMGEDLYHIARPLGVKERVLLIGPDGIARPVKVKERILLKGADNNIVKERDLLIGADDNMLLNELSLFAPQILARANAFMNEPYFRRVRLELLQNRAPLYPRRHRNDRDDLAEYRPKPANLGRMVNRVNPDTPAGRAYLAYVKSFEE